MPITSTYNDTSNAGVMGDWTLLEYNPGHEYSEDPDDPTLTRRRRHHVLRRYRLMKEPIVYVSMEGQVGVGASLGSANGGVMNYPTNANQAFICSDDILLPLFPNAYRQEQVWEHFSDYEAYDVGDLNA